jgi:hypothetical protein
VYTCGLEHGIVVRVPRWLELTIYCLAGVGAVVLVAAIIAGFIVAAHRLGRGAPPGGRATEHSLARVLLLQIIKDFRNFLAFLLVAGFMALLFSTLIWPPDKKTLEGIKTMMATVGALVGPVIGFYFANHRHGFRERVARDVEPEVGDAMEGEVIGVPPGVGDPSGDTPEDPTNTAECPAPEPAEPDGEAGAGTVETGKREDETHAD